MLNTIRFECIHCGDLLDLNDIQDEWTQAPEGTAMNVVGQNFPVVCPMCSASMKEEMEFCEAEEEVRFLQQGDC
jgi:hypothetical protein